MLKAFKKTRIQKIVKGIEKSFKFICLYKIKNLNH